MARQPKYTSRISAVVPAEIRDRLKAVEAAHPVSLNDVIREALSAGLPEVERRYADDEQPMAAAESA